MRECKVEIIIAHESYEKGEKGYFSRFLFRIVSKHIQYSR
jgi:hypothetical protein